jgi:hypothetical protein
MSVHSVPHPMLAPLRFVPRRPAYRIALLAAILAAAAATTWQLWPQAQTPSATTPAWFQPIAAYYHNDPAITPQFDFASLYSGNPPPWFNRIAAYYHYNPAITPQFDFASLYGGPPAGWHPGK